MKTLRSLGIAAGVTTLALLAGCSAGSASMPAGSVAAEEEPGDMSAGGRAEDTGALPSAAEGQPGEVPGPAVAQKLARTARVGITVTDVEAAATQLRDLAVAMGGQVTAENLVTRADADTEEERGPVSTIVISVPADRLDSTLDQLKSVGTLSSRVISSEDVTIQVADVDSRIKTLDASIDRLRDLSEKAGSIRELTELEAQLTSRIAERDSLIAQQRSLAGRVAQSPITVTLRTPAQASELETTGFLGGLIAGWNALLASSKVLMTVIGAVLPFAAVVAVVLVPLLLWRRARRRRAAAPVSPVGGTDDPGSDSLG
jgi:hypothetical protein